VHVSGKELRELESPEQQRTGYRGPRRRVLVVDNERVDRELLLNILTPLGFEVAQAASGLECLDLYTAFQPDVILMDLAMPGMDGWEASYILRRRQLSAVPIAIVSANAFDKGMDNPAGIRAEDFFIKPVNVGELLDWIGARLSLEWITQTPAVPIAPAAPPLLVFPPAAVMTSLRELIRIGYVRGIQNKLDEIGALDPRYQHFTQTMRNFAARFQLDAMADFVRKNNNDELQH
jgi:CheY-like chemotaxis protein